MGRLIKAKLLLQLFDKTRVDTARPAGVIVDLYIGTAHIQPCAGHGVSAFKTRQHLVNRPTGGGLHNHEVKQHDPEQSRDH